MRGFSDQNDDNSNNDDKRARLATSHALGKSGMIAVQASERLMLPIPSHHRRDTSDDAPTTARAYAGGLATVRASERLLLPSRRHKRDRVRSLSNSSGESRADNAGKLEEGIRYIGPYSVTLPAKFPFSAYLTFVPNEWGGIRSPEETCVYVTAVDRGVPPR